MNDQCPKCGAKNIPQDANHPGAWCWELWRCGSFTTNEKSEKPGRFNQHYLCKESVLKQELSEEKDRHKSVCDSIRGERHAWYCTSQLADCECNCGMQIKELKSLLLKVVSGETFSTEQVNKALEGVE